MLYVAGYGPDAGRIVRAAREQGSKLQMVGGDGLGMQEFWTEAGAAGEGTIFTTRPRPCRQRPRRGAVLAALRALGVTTQSTVLGCYAAVQVLGGGGDARGQPRPGQRGAGPASRPVRERAGSGRLRREGRCERRRPGNGGSGTTAATRPCRRGWPWDRVEPRSDRGILDAAAAVDLERHAGDELVPRRRRATGRRWPRPRACSAGPSGTVADEAGAVLGRVAAQEVSQQRRLARHRAERVDPDVLRRQLDRHRLGDQDAGTLAAIVPAQARPRPQAGGRGGIDRSTPPPCAAITGTA